MTDKTISREKWGQGTWESEPDRVEWRHEGLPCLAVRHELGHWCGYAGVPPGHPWYQLLYHHDDVDVIDVHGGLTYSNKCQGDICHVPAEGEPDTIWWFGFDCAHHGDNSPGLRLLLGNDYSIFSQGVYRDLVYVKRQVNQLAEQLAQVKTRRAP